MAEPNIVNFAGHPIIVSDAAPHGPRIPAGAIFIESTDSCSGDHIGLLVDRTNAAALYVALGCALNIWQV